MSRPLAPIVCDGPGCTNRKQESNHWWTIERFNDGERPDIRITAGTLDVRHGNVSVVFDACGQDCALKIVSEQMGKVTS